MARGDAEIGFQQVSELLPEKGTDYGGPLPPEVQRVTIFSAGIASGRAFSVLLRRMKTTPRSRSTACAGS